MGTDIHMFVEKRVNGTWKHAGSFGYDGRDYELFAWLADVRNSNLIKSIDQPRGFPADVDPETITEYSEDDDHSASWREAIARTIILRQGAWSGTSGHARSGTASATSLRNARRR